MCGIPASGKSTLSRSIQGHYTTNQAAVCVVVSYDDFISEEKESKLVENEVHDTESGYDFHNCTNMWFLQIYPLLWLLKQKKSF